MRPHLAAAIWVEARKARTSSVVLGTTLLFIAGIAILSAALSLAADAGNEQVLAQLGPLADRDDWGRLVGVASQTTAAGGLLAFGVVLSWLIGREFADATITGLFALPIRRSTIALAKLVTYLAWTTLIALGLTALVAALGLALDLGLPDAPAVAALGRLLTLTLLTALLALPAAWVSTLGRGLLPGIATTVATLVAAQVMVVAGTGAWFPPAAPALWAVTPDTVTAAQLSLVPAVSAAFIVLTTQAWAELQLDR